MTAPTAATAGAPTRAARSAAARLRGDPLARRPPAMAGTAMVASAHPRVSLAGASVLAAGGTATDAVLAMAAMGFVVLPGQCGVGGDAFAVTYEAATGRYRAYNGSGPGPDGGDVAFYRGRGHATVPLTGALAATVPGALSCLAALHADGATMALSDLWAPAIAAAHDGVPLSAKTVTDIAANAALRADPAAARVFTPGGRVPTPGDRLAQADLAASLRRLAADPADLYTGALAERCLAALTAAGAPFSGDEWAAQRTVATDTVTMRYQGHLLHTGPPQSPGYQLAAQAGALDAVLADLPWLGPQAVHAMAEAARLSFADRARLVDSDSDTWRDLLSPGALTARRAEILRSDLAGAAAAGLSGAGDTTSCVAVDTDGNAVSFLHSLALTFGACVMVPGTGITLNNRLGRGAHLDPGRPNHARPGRAPMHTLTAWLVADAAGRPAFAGNTPGGDGQVQWGMQLVSHLLDAALDPQRAVEAPRFTVFPGSDAHTRDAVAELRCEDRLGPQTLAALAGAGHPVRTLGPFGADGAAQVIQLDHRRGTLLGGSDPRQEGCALGV